MALANFKSMKSYLLFSKHISSESLLFATTILPLCDQLTIILGTLCYPGLGNVNELMEWGHVGPPACPFRCNQTLDLSTLCFVCDY